MRILFVAFFVFNYGLSVFSQGSILEKFSANENGSEIILNWIIEKGNTCNGIDIQRSTDSLNFQVIGDIEGICGDQEKSVSYTFIDKNPENNTKNYYRLQLGSVGTSEIISVFHAFIDEKGYSMRPNPFFSQSTIYYSNENNVLHELSIFNLNGNLIKKLKSMENSIKLHKENMQAGLYLFTLKSESGSLNTVGKFIVVN